MGGSGSKQVQSDLDELIAIQKAMAKKQGVNQANINKIKGNI